MKSGFGVFQIVLAVAAVAILALAGYLAFHKAFSSEQQSSFLTTLHIAGHPEIRTDGKSVFVDSTVLEGSDPSSFVVLNQVYAKDSYHVYTIKIDEESEAMLMPAADPKTFSVLGERYGKDSKHAYWNGSLIANADPASFETFGETYYAKDAKHVYRTYYAIDDLHLDPRTFKALGYVYIADAKSVYYFTDDQTKKVVGADPTTFSVVANYHPGDPYDAQDKNFHYIFGEVATY